MFETLEFCPGLFSVDRAERRRHPGFVTRSLDDLLECLRRLDGAELAEKPTVRTLVTLLQRELSQTTPAEGSDAVVSTEVLGDPRVHRACALLHGDLARPWTVEELARSVSMSRAAFARRFAEVMGVGPARYLTRARLEWAADRLHRSDASLAEVAWEVGYTSEFAFGRAFKRHHGVPPGEYRRSLRTVGAGTTLACAA